MAISMRSTFFWGGLHGSAWWFQPTALKNHGELVNWDDEIPN